MMFSMILSALRKVVSIKIVRIGKKLSSAVSLRIMLPISSLSSL